jgi:hypothetical protein
MESFAHSLSYTEPIVFNTSRLFSSIIRVQGDRVCRVSREKSTPLL